MSKSIETCLLHQTLAAPPKLQVGMATLVAEGALVSQPINFAR